MIFKKLFTAALFFCIISVTDSGAQSPITALESFESGEIVTISRPENEIGSELDVFLSVLVPAPLTKTVDFFQRQSNSKDIPDVIFIQEII